MILKFNFIDRERKFQIFLNFETDLSGFVHKTINF